MDFITDANGEQCKVEDIGAALVQVAVFLTDKEILPAMTAEEIMYYRDLQKKLLQLQLTEGQ